MFAPARFLDFARNDGTKYRFARFYNVICKCGHRRLAYGGSPFAPALVSTSLKMTEAKYRSARLAAGRGRPALPRRSYARQRIVILKRYTPRADEERPYLSSQSLILPLLKCHFDRSVSVVEKSPTEVTRLPRYYNLFRPLKRCGVRDTVASVPATFGFFFFARKRTFIFPFLKKKFVTISKVSHSGSECGSET